jgi:hypothetical protein
MPPSGAEEMDYRRREITVSVIVLVAGKKCIAIFNAVLKNVESVLM